MTDVPRSMLCRWEAAAWAALYDRNNGPMIEARREMMAKINEPAMETESVTGTPHPMPPQVVSFTSNGDGSYHVVWDDGTEADMVTVKAALHRWSLSRNPIFFSVREV